MKRFLYLAQVERDLPARLRPLQSDDSDIRFLSWKARSEDPRSVFYPHSSWTEGRNRLYKEIAGTAYLYYIFVDDDIEMRVAGGGRGSTWRQFERFLLDYEPAVGVPHYLWHLQPEGRDRARPVQTIRFFDACVNAFHREAVHILLPYCDLLDRCSECYSQSIVCSQAALLYRDHVLQCNRVEAVNLERRRPEREYLYCRADDLFLATLRDPADYAAFRRLTKGTLLSHPPLGEARRKGSQSYAVSPQEMGRRLDLSHPLWARQKQLAEWPKNAEFFSDRADTRRAMAWKAEKAARTGPPLKPAWDVRVRSAARSGIAWGLRRSATLSVANRARKALRDRVRRFAAETRAARRPRAAVSGNAPLQRTASTLGRIVTPWLTMIDVGGLREDSIRALVDAMPRQPILSIGVSATPRPEYLNYIEFALGEVSTGPEDPRIPRYRLSTLLRQFGIAGEVIHFLAIEGQASNVEAFRSLDSYIADCLFLRIAMPVADRAVVEAHGFRLFAPVDAAGTASEELIFVNVDLLARLVPATGEAAGRAAPC